VRVSI